ncbi:MAG TPA: hypothetical protein VHK88_07200, partial [Aquihabitans sp.]|nr:hypothetical protein [Aquihabitans sp.]
LDPLGDAEVAELLRARGVAADAARQAIVELAGGSPLLAVQLADTLTAEERSGVHPVPESLRVPAEVSELYLRRMDGLGDDARQALAVASADAGAGGTATLAALAVLGLGPADLEAAEERGLVAVAAGHVRFTHPLARSAVYQGVPGPVRRRAHAALAEAEAAGAGGTRAVLHRAAAAVGSDDELADALADLAADALRRGAAMTAASRGAQAATLAADPTRRADLLVGAARAALVAGEPRRAREFLDAARRADAERAADLDARRIEIRLAVAAGEVEAAWAQVEAVDAAFSATDPVAVAELLGEVARPLLPTAPFVAAPLTERLWELAADAEEPARLYAEVLYGCGRFVQGDVEGAARHTAAWPELLRQEGAVVTGPFLAESVVLYQAYSYQVAEAFKLLDEVEGQIRRHCASGALVSVLNARSLISYGVDLRDCVAAGREALHLSEETGQPGLISVAATTIAIASATVGDEALTTEVCDRLLAAGDERSEVWARAALGRLHLVHGRPEAAVAQFALLRERVGEHNVSYAQFEADEAEALVRVGRVDDARALL